MNAETPAYGLWSLVIINTAVFIIFAFSFTHPRTGHFGLMGMHERAHFVGAQLHIHSALGEGTTITVIV